MTKPTGCGAVYPIVHGVRSLAVTLAAVASLGYACALVGETDTLESTMLRYVGGDRAAFAALYDALAPKVFGYLVTMTHDRTRAEDLCQTVFLKVHRARSGWMPDAPVTPWVMAIARNVFVDEVRSRMRSKLLLTDSGDLPDDAALPAEDDGGWNASDWAARAEDIKAVVLELPVMQREAFVLTKEHGMSIRDAALVLGVTEMAVKLRVHRAVETLRKRLATKGADA